MSKTKPQSIIMVKVPANYSGVSYAPIDAFGEDELKGRDTIAVTLMGLKATRTALQNNAIHVYFTDLCKALNDAGMDMVATMAKLSKKGKIPWSPLAIKERLWRPVQLDTYGTESTTKLSTSEVSAVYEALNEVTSSRLGVGVPFPDKYSQMDIALGRK